MDIFRAGVILHSVSYQNTDSNHLLLGHLLPECFMPDKRFAVYLATSAIDFLQTVKIGPIASKWHVYISHCWLWCKPHATEVIVRPL